MNSKIRAAARIYRALPQYIKPNFPEIANHPFGWFGGFRRIWYNKAVKRIATLFVVLLAALMHGEQVRFTSIRELTKTKLLTLPREERFDATGQVVSAFTRDGNPTICITDGSETIAFINYSTNRNVHVGDIVHITGKVIRDPQRKDSGIKAYTFDVLLNAPLPRTDPLSWNDFYSSQGNIGPCSVSGVVTSVMRDDLDVHWNWLTLRDGVNAIPVAMTEEEYPLSALKGIVDAEVVLHGFMGSMLSVFSKNYLNLFGTNGILVVRKAQEPFTAPKLGKGNPCHRLTVRGTVKAVGDKWLFMQAAVPIPHPSDLISVHLSEAQTDVRPGDVVTVSGFRNLESINIQFTGAVVRREGETEPFDEKPIDIAIEDLFTSPLGLWQVSQDWHGKLIRVSGTVVTTPGETGATGIMRLRKGDMTIEVQVSGIDASGYADVEEGCKVAVTGLCIVELEEQNGISVLPKFRRTLVLPRTADDIKVVARRPWWTPARLVAMIALLSAFLAGAMWWNKVLKERARRHAEALVDERIAHSAAEVKVEVRTHLAVELHDSISQSLTGIALQLDSAERANPSENTRVARFLGLARQMLGSCRRELQSCLLDLRNRTFEEKDLSEAIRRTVSPLSENAEVSVRFNVPRETLSDTAVHVILKIIRELVVNAIRHGGAKHVRIAGERDGETIRFAVRDDGTGFDPASAPGPMQGHFGLQGIRERVDEFGGTVEVESECGMGTKVTVTMKTAREK